MVIIMKKLAILLGTVLLLLLVAMPCFAGAWEIRGGDEVIEEGQVLDGDLLFSGDRLEINGDIKGDLVVWAGRVVVNGRVEGSVLGFVWDKLTVNGVVQGSLRGLAGEAVINGQINGSLTMAALTLNTGKNSLVERGILSLTSRLSLLGTVNGPVDVNSVPTIKIGGRINGDLKTQGAPITWRTPVVISGKVNDYSGVSSDPAKIKGVIIGGGYHLHQENTANSQLSWVMTLGSVVWFVGSLLATLILFKLFPRTFWAITDPAPAVFRRNLLIGLISFLGMPLAVALLFFSLAGIPLAILLGLVYVILLLFSGIPVNLWFGRLLFRSRLHPSLMIIFGGLALMLISFIPLINLVFSFVMTGLGFGMIIGNFKPQFGDKRRMDLEL